MWQELSRRRSCISSTVAGAVTIVRRTNTVGERWLALKEGQSTPKHRFPCKSYTIRAMHEKSSESARSECRLVHGCLRL
jgi:hypothetical protein